MPMSRRAPAPRPDSTIRLPGGACTTKPRSACTWRGGRSGPLPGRRGARGSLGGRPSTSPPSGSGRARRASVTISSAWAMFRVSGFSHRTCLPASRASRACSRWRACGRGDVDDVDGRVGDQPVVRRVRAAARVAVLRGEGLGASPPCASRRRPAGRPPPRGGPGRSSGRCGRWPGCPTRYGPSSVLLFARRHRAPSLENSDPSRSGRLRWVE